MGGCQRGGDIFWLLDRGRGWVIGYNHRILQQLSRFNSLLQAVSQPSLANCVDCTRNDQGTTDFAGNGAQTRDLTRVGIQD